jgi:hypothetical protein
MTIVKDFNGEPYLSLGPLLTLEGNGGLLDFHRLKQRFSELDQCGRRWERGDRHMIEIETSDLVDEEKRMRRFGMIESQMNQAAKCRGWTWKLSRRDDPLDLRVIDAEDQDFHSTMHEIGAKRRQEYYKLQEGRYRAYFTGTFVGIRELAGLRST